MWNDNKLTRLLGIQYPIIQAGMAGSTTASLVATVSEKGGLGTIGAGYFSIDKLESEIKAVKEKSSQPFGVNLFVPNQNATVNPLQVDQMNEWLKPYRRAFHLEEPVVNIDETQKFNEAVNMIIKYKVPICSFTFGIPDALTIKKLKEHQVILIGTATTVEEAIENEKAGIDIVVAQGSEAGGHRGAFLQIGHSTEPMVGTMSLVPQIVDHVSIPVVAAGGIMDERGLLASLMLGAQGVQMGTAFLTSHESGANELLKDTILKSKETDTVVTNVFSGKNARGINNQFVKELNEYQGDIPDYPIQNQLTAQIRKAAVQQGESELTHIWSGQSPRLAEKQKAADLIERMVSRINDMSNL